MNPLWISILIYAVIIFIAYKILKSILKALFVASIIVSVSLAVVGFMLIKDVNDIKANFQTMPRLMLLEDNDEVLTGLIINDGEAVKINRSHLMLLSEQLRNNQKADMLEDNYKMITYSLDLLKDMDNFSLSFGSVELPRDEIIVLMKNEGRAKYWAEKMFIPDYQEVRTLVFSELLQQKWSGEQNIPLFINGLKSGTIKIYPETITFKLIKFIPSSLMSSRLVQIAA